MKQKVFWLASPSLESQRHFTSSRWYAALQKFARAYPKPLPAGPSKPAATPKRTGP